MKRFILLLVMLGLYLTGHSQSEIGRLTFDSGYYEGVCRDSNPKSKYITYLYLQFLSNKGDSMLVVFPYRMKKTTVPTTYQKYVRDMNDTVDGYFVKLSKMVNDIENHEIVNRPRTINGFDNFTYYEVVGNCLSFSINIADINTNSIEVFYFEGTIGPTGNDINAVVYSDNGTFEKGQIRLVLSPKIISQK